MHPPDYHKSDEARKRCWGCSHPENLTMSKADIKKAHQLVAEGWMSTSNKYCNIARINAPMAKDAMSFDRSVPDWIKEKMRDAYNCLLQFPGGAPRNGVGVEYMTLTSNEHRAFKMVRDGRARADGTITENPFSY